MAKNFKLLLLVLLLLIGIAVYFYNTKAGSSSMSDNSRDFSIENTDRIGKIFVTDRTGDSYILEKKSNVWYADSTYPADPEFVNILLTTVRKMTVTNLVPKPAIPNVMKDIATIGKKVEIYDINGNKLRSFYIGNSNQRVNGSYMVLEGYNIPYEMGITGFNGDIGGRFWPLHRIDIRSKQLLNYKAGDIKKVEVEYPRDKDESFALDISGFSNYTLSPTNPTTKPSSKKISKAAIEKFLSNMESVQATYVVPTNMLGADTLVSSVPFAKFIITGKNDNKKSMDLYPILTGENKIGLGYEPASYFVVINNQNFYKVQNAVINKLLWGYSYFYE